jgi:dihydrofolate synthase/folylpolyglutamate synthase
VVIGETIAETLPVFKAQAKEMNAPIHFAEETLVPEIPLDLLGNYQKKNKRTAYKALKVLLEVDQLPKNALDGFAKVTKNTGLRGRWEIIDQQPEIVADVSHNAEGFRTVVYQLKKKKPDSELHFVLGFVKGKQLDTIFSMLPINAQYYFCAPSIERALAVSEVIEVAEKYKLNTRIFTTPEQALQAAKRSAKSMDLIYVGGSTFVVAEILS